MTTPARPATTRRYRVTAPKDWPADHPPFGIDYPGRDGREKRAVAGEIVSDFPPNAKLEWLLAQGYIEEVR